MAGQMKLVEVGNTRAVLINADGDLHSICYVFTDGECLISEGRLVGGQVRGAYTRRQRAVGIPADARAAESLSTWSIRHVMLLRKALTP